MGRGKKPTPGPSLVLERAPHRADGRNGGGGKRGKQQPPRPTAAVARLLARGACLAATAAATATVLWPSTLGPPLPDTSVDALAALLTQPLPELSVGVSNEAVSALSTAAMQAAFQGRHFDAAELYRDILEARPSDGYMQERFFASLKQVQPAGIGPRDVGNSSDAFRVAMEANLASGAGELLSRDPPAYVLHGVLSRAEAASLLKTREQFRDKWRQTDPLVCFTHRRFQRDARLAASMRHGLGAGGRRSCLNASLSAAAYRTGAVRWSESLAVYRGQDELLDEVSTRLSERAGLRETTGLHFQMLKYAPGASYHAHTDCSAADDLLASDRTRMATALVYLNSDDFEAGETEFTRAVGGPLKAKPPVGSALLFYSHGPSFGGRRCSARAEHRANPVRRGVKHVLQKWYAYRDDPFFNLRPWRNPGEERLRAPWQPVVQCDHLDQATPPEPDVSCRWYNQPDQYIFEHTPGSNPEPT